MKTLIATLGTLMLSITPAFAQQATSFDQLQVLVRPGDTIVVTDTGGHSTKGKVQSISPSTLKIAHNKEVREFTQNETLQITERRQDGLGNGAAAGAAVGGGFGTLVVIAACRASSGCNTGVALEYIGINSAFGAGVGVLIDALVTHRRTIFQAQKTTALRRFDFKPIVSKDAKGAAVAFQF